MRKSEMRELVEQKVLLTGPIRPARHGRSRADRRDPARAPRGSRRAALSHARRRPAAGRRRNVRESATWESAYKRLLPSDGAPTVPVRVMSSSAREQ